MAYIQREGGDRFVIPSYRDVISKRKSRLKLDILELSSKYGEFMTFHRRGLAQFEVAFSHEAGFLFGECVWSYFKKPTDLIYCEAIPDTSDAYLVIVKNSSVYLDGVFPMDSIPEELVVFTTQKSHFEIYTYGEVSISQEPVEGKFTLETASVKAYTIMDKPLFANLPTVKTYRLQLVDVVLRQEGIGVFPIKYVIGILMIIGLGYMGHSYITMQKKKMATVVVTPPPENPYVDYNKNLLTPPPAAELKVVCDSIKELFTLPGWVASGVNYTKGTMDVDIMSGGGSTRTLYEWADANGATVNIKPTGFSLTLKLPLPPERSVPSKIYPLNRIIADLVDRLTEIMPGNVLSIAAYKKSKIYQQSTVKIRLHEVSPETIILVAEQLKDLPLVLTNVSIKIDDALTGTVTLEAYGN